MRPVYLITALGLSSGAQADTTATYANTAAKFSMSVRIASNGDIRGEVPGRTYYYVGGQDYFVDQTDNGVIVMRLDDMIKVIGEKFAELSAKMDMQSFVPPTITFVHRGSVVVSKWSGDAYYMQAANGVASPRPVAVISHDPSLGELGRAMARQYAKSEMMMGQMMKGREPTSNLDHILSSGAPISFAGADLQSVSFDPIPKHEFVLPAQPAPIDDVRKRMSQK